MEVWAREKRGRLEKKGTRKKITWGHTSVMERKEVNCNDKSVNLKIVMVRIQSTFFYLGRSVPFIQSPKI